MEEGKKSEEKKPKSSQFLLREFAAGGVVFKKNSQALWLVTKSSPSKKYPEEYWRLPKGWLDDANSGREPGELGRGIRKAREEEIRLAALREVEEEGGVKAKILGKISVERYFSKFGGKTVLKFVTFYLMEWLSDLKEGPGFETSEIAWLPFREARERLTNNLEKKVLDKAKKLLDSGRQRNLI